MASQVAIVLYAGQDEVDKYSEEGLRNLWIDILERYGNEEYYDPDLVKELLEHKPE